MKSLVEEASSITKAIEKAWTRAGKPQSFSVKIFETPETGFLGFTKKSAKVGIFFEETSVEKPQNRGNHKNASHQERQSERSGQDNRQSRSGDRPQRKRNDRGDHQERTQSARPQQRRDNRSARSEGQDRPQRRRDDRGQGPWPQRRSEERPARRDDRKETASEQKPTTPKETTPSPLTTSMGTVKRAPKISGRRFVGTKKSDSNE